MKSAEVDREIERQIALARAAEQDGGWVTYLMRDPRRPDLRGNPAGWPVYVGQTDEFGKRVRNHLRKAEKNARKGKGIKARLKELLHAGVVPAFEVLDRQPTRLKSLLSETNYARLCRSRGYDIANQTTLQNSAGAPVTLTDLPIRWLWRFSPSQAAEDGIEIGLACRGCGNVVWLPASAFADLPEPPKELREIRDSEKFCQARCTLCDHEGARVTLRVSDDGERG